MREFRVAALIAALLTTGWGASAQEQGAQLQWQHGPATFPIGNDVAEIELSERYLFLDRANTEQLMSITGNPLTGREVGTIAGADESNWFLVLEWDEVGYVSDEEKNDLDASALLQTIQEGTEASNEERRKRGWSEFHVIGWREPPHYDEGTHNLTWAIVGESDGNETINRTIKLLGRRGVMTTTLVANPDKLAGLVPIVDSLLESYRFRAGSTYAEFVPGQDRMAELGLAALVAGGAGALLVKSGLLARFWKLIVVGVLGTAAAVRKFFTGTRAEDQPITKV